MNYQTVRWMLIAAFAVTGGSVSAKTFEVSAWKGETVAVAVPDFADLGPAPAGLSVRQGVLRRVEYAPKPHSVQRVACYDRVEWDGKGPGPRLVEVSVPPDAKPGVYTCGMMEIRVVDRVLPPPSKWQYYLDLWQHPWAVARMANVKPFSKAHYDAMRPVWRTLATAGQKTLTVTLLPEPWNHQCRDAYGTMVSRVRHADGSWTFDYSVFDAYVEFGRSCGLGPDIACYTLCPWGYVVRWTDDAGNVQSAVAKPGTKEFEDYWGPFLKDFSRHLSDRGWLKDVYIAMDERSVEDVRAIGEFLGKTAPGLRISMAGNHLPSRYGVQIDNFCMTLGDVINDEFLAEAAERRTKGLVTTFYTCCSPERPNTFMSSGPGEAFWLGAYPAACGLDGYLRWAWNSWPEAPELDATYSNWMAGDTYLVYPDGSPSWRFLELRNGIATAEKIWILRKEGNDAARLERICGRFSPRDATRGQTDFERLRTDVIKLVNK